jgi:predicted Zn-dependent peptidase
VVAAALFGEGMSSPLMDEIRERRGLVYYAACSCDATDIAGQFVIEASMSPGKVQEFAAEVTRLLRAHADAIDPLHLERARNQIAVRRLEVQERPFRRIEEAVQDVFAFARVRTNAETMDRVRAVTAQEVRDAFARMLDSQASVAMAGRVSQAALASLRGLVASAP